MEIHVIRRWCWDNGISIYPIPVIPNGKILKIAVNINGNEKIGTQTYDNKNVYDKINELYRQIYER
ncbi:MAG: hypothetical protein Q4G08_11635, partial [Capnocytophaga sp.]|nr:hypothetical protein [Capnocytophaga sp.]